MDLKSQSNLWVCVAGGALNTHTNTHFSLICVLWKR